MVKLLKAKYPGRDYVFECDMPTAHYKLRPLTSRTQAYRAPANKTTRAKLSKIWFVDDF